MKQLSYINPVLLLCLLCFLSPAKGVTLSADHQVIRKPHQALVRIPVAQGQADDLQAQIAPARHWPRIGLAYPQDAEQWAVTVERGSILVKLPVAGGALTKRLLLATTGPEGRQFHFTTVAIPAFERAPAPQPVMAAQPEPKQPKPAPAQARAQTTRLAWAGTARESGGREPEHTASPVTRPDLPAGAVSAPSLRLPDMQVNAPVEAADTPRTRPEAPQSTLDREMPTGTEGTTVLVLKILLATTWTLVAALLLRAYFAGRRKTSPAAARPDRARGPAQNPDDEKQATDQAGTPRDKEPAGKATTAPAPVPQTAEVTEVTTNQNDLIVRYARGEIHGEMDDDPFNLLQGEGA